MKIAICLSGQPRFLEKGIQSLKENFLNVNQIDLFIHTWYDENNNNKNFDSSQYYLESKVGAQNEKTKEILLDLKPQKIIFENPKSFSEFSHLKNRETAIQTKLASMFYSCFQANELKKQHEEENNFKYDIVIKTRTDILYQNGIKFLEYSKNDLDKYIYASSMYQECRMNDEYYDVNKLKYSSLSDTWLMSSSNNIDIACNVFPQFEKFHKLLYPIVYGESYLGYLTRGLNNTPIKTIDIKYKLIRN